VAEVRPGLVLGAFNLLPRALNRRQVWVAVAVGAVIVLAAPFAIVPSVVKSRAEAALHARTGLQAKIESVSLGAAGASLKGVHLEPEDGEGVEIDVQKVDAHFGWPSALFNGSSAIHAVEASGVEAEVDIASPAFAALRDKLRAKREGADADAPKTARKLEASNVAVIVKEGANELLNVEDASAQLGASEITLSLSQVNAKRPGLANAALRGVEVIVQREGGMRVQQVKVAEAQLAIQTPVARPAAAAAPREKEREEPEDEAALDPGQQPMAAVTAVADSGAHRKSLQALLAKLTPDAVFELSRARIEQIKDGKSAPVLTDVSCELRLLPGGALRITGKGAAQAGGRLDADMRFWPDDLRADGRVTIAGLPLTLLVPILPSVPWYEPEKSRINAELTIKAESPARLSLDGYANLRDASLYAERLANAPVQGISLSIAGRGHWLPAERRLEIESGSLGVGKARADVRGAVELANDHYAFDVSANLPATPCTDAVRSIPSALLGDMSVAQWKGSIAGKLRFSTDSRDLDKTELKVDFTDRCDFQLVPVMADLSRFAKPFIHSVTEPDGTVFEMETGPGTPNWTPLEAMSPFFVNAVLVHEDPQFFNHHGFSPINIRNALARNLKERRYAVGASTISMQLVKNIFLHREKTLGRKVQEVLLTWWTERVMEKRDILELYFNVIEYGPGIYGIRNAALHYWNRLPSELSPAEGVFLATILPNPKKFHSFYERNAISSGWASNMRRMLTRLAERGNYDREAADYGLAELEHFKFARGNAAAPPRTITGSTTPLPYELAARQDTIETNTFGAAQRGFD